MALNLQDKQQAYRAVCDRMGWMEHCMGLAWARDAGGVIFTVTADRGLLKHRLDYPDKINPVVRSDEIPDGFFAPLREQYLPFQDRLLAIVRNGGSGQLKMTLDKRSELVGPVIPTVETRLEVTTRRIIFG
jgi:hypothetical protein